MVYTSTPEEIAHDTTSLMINSGYRMYLPTAEGSKPYISNPTVKEVDARILTVTARVFEVLKAKQHIEVSPATGQSVQIEFVLTEAGKVEGKSKRRHYFGEPGKYHGRNYVEI